MGGPLCARGHLLDVAQRLLFTAQPFEGRWANILSRRVGVVLVMGADHAVDYRVRPATSLLRQTDRPANPVASTRQPDRCRGIPPVECRGQRRGWNWLMECPANPQSLCSLEIRGVYMELVLLLD